VRSLLRRAARKPRPKGTTETLIAPLALELAINLKTATALGLSIPTLMLERADEVFE
jgi:hypothetical protein